MSPRILIFGRTPNFLSAAEAAFAAAGSETELADLECPVEGELQRFAPDLIVLEGGLRRTNTSELLRTVRASRTHGGLPILVVGGELDELERIVAFELGADDVLSGPLSRRELILRANAILKRVRSNVAPGSLDRGAIEIGALHIADGGLRATLNETSLALTALEGRLLYALALHCDRVRPRDELIRTVWNGHYPKESRTLDTHIRRLRRKLGWGGRAIETLRGVGYRLRSEALALEANETRAAFQAGRDGSP